MEHYSIAEEKDKWLKERVKTYKKAFSRECNRCYHCRNDSTVFYNDKWFCQKYHGLTKVEEEIKQEKNKKLEDILEEPLKSDSESDSDDGPIRECTEEEKMMKDCSICQKEFSPVDYEKHLLGERHAVLAVLEEKLDKKIKEIKEKFEESGSEEYEDAE